MGKVYNLFARRGITRTLRAKNDTEAMIHLETVAQQRFAGLCLANLAGFDKARPRRRSGGLHPVVGRF